MKKIIASLLSALMLIVMGLSLSACGENDSEQKLAKYISDYDIADEMSSGSDENLDISVAAKDNAIVVSFTLTGEFPPETTAAISTAVEAQFDVFKSNQGDYLAQIREDSGVEDAKLMLELIDNNDTVLKSVTLE